MHKDFAYGYPAMRLSSRIFLTCLTSALTASAALDQNGNQQSDIWENKFSATGLPQGGDVDRDGFTNKQESIAGTDPLNPYSRPGLSIEVSGGQIQPFWSSLTGKRYQLLGNVGLDPLDWQIVGTVDGIDDELAAQFPLGGPNRFFRIQVLDKDTDSDGLTDWEERQIGFDPTTNHTQRFDTADLQRAASAWSQPSTINLAVLDSEISEGWPDKGTVAIRRAGGMKPITVNLTFAGTATRNGDYTSNAATSIDIPAGVREVWVEITPVPDVEDESAETIIVTATAGTGYTVGAANSGTISLANETASSPPNAKSAVRFLIQAAFGPDQDDVADADLIPENAEQVMQQGFEGWIDAEFAKPATHLQPFAEYANAPGNIDEFYADPKIAAWWSRAMGTPTEVPGGPAVAHDVLRQRVAFCLSQILVTSDRPEALAVEPVAMSNYYDVLVDHAFGNYRNLLYHVTRHPVMGFYLSALKNQKPDPVNNIFPDENYAREVMQLFSIGLWELEQNGLRKKLNGQFVPTYNNTTITNFARVFTGMTFDSPGGFLGTSNNWLDPMRLEDDYHDCDPKTLLNGVTLPARIPNSPTPGAATDADLWAAIDNLFNHPNVGPFIGRQLIQRLVTSNPSNDYIARVAAKFADNGNNVRGDMKAVIKAILLDPEARDPAKMADPQFGKVREPFLRVVNLARAFNASSPSGYYQIGSFFMDHYQEPMKSPSVFNFYLPGYTPPGEIQSAGLVAPEMQVVNATSAISAPNYYYTAILSGLHRWGTADQDRNVRLNLTHELTLVDDVDALIRRLDIVLTGGTLTPQLQQVIRETVLRISTSAWEYENERLRLAIWLIVTSPEYCVLR